MWLCRGRNFPAVSYTSSLAPMRDNSVPLAVLVNSGTASAAEIVSGAVQDLDSGVIVGSDRTFGKGLVQNVESLPYNTALKYTVAKYYTPSGRCIQSVRYEEEAHTNHHERNGWAGASRVVCLLPWMRCSGTSRLRPARPRPPPSCSSE